MSGQDTTISWLSFEETALKFQEKQKPIMIFMYAEDDTISEKMIKETFSKNEVVNYLNILYYPIKLNVYSNDTITFFNNTKFYKLPDEKYHSLVNFLTGDSVTSPLMVIFNKQAEGRVFYGFKNRDSIFATLIYYSEEIYKSTTYEDWEEIYFKAYPPGQQQIMTRLIIRWQTIDEMKTEFEQKPKKILIDLYDNYSVASTVMKTQTYNKKEIAEYLNKNFYRVSVELRSTQEFEFLGVTYKNSGPPYNYHQFVYSVLQGNFKFPAFIILDEEMNLLDRIQVFLTPQAIDPILHFYGDNYYKTQNYEEFLKNYKK